MKKALPYIIASALAVIGIRYAWLFVTAPAPSATLAETPYPDEDPLQNDLPSFAPIKVSFDGGIAKIKPRATYEITGAVCGLNHLKHSKLVGIIPYDLCLKWGRLATEDMKGKVTFKHDSLRLDWVQVSPGAPVDFQYVSLHFSNNHLMCADDEVCKAISRLDRGDVVKITGYLADAIITTPEREWDWKTSMDRGDTGLGACETIYVTSIQAGKKLYGIPIEQFGK